jgi:hypothetical protein
VAAIPNLIQEAQQETESSQILDQSVIAISQMAWMNQKF